MRPCRLRSDFGGAAAAPGIVSPQNIFASRTTHAVSQFFLLHDVLPRAFLGVALLENKSSTSRLRLVFFSSSCFIPRVFTALLMVLAFFGELLRTSRQICNRVAHKPYTPYRSKSRSQVLSSSKDRSAEKRFRGSTCRSGLLQAGQPYAGSSTAAW